MTFEIHREPLFKRYYAPLFSSACCYAIAFGFILIFLPLILAYNSSDFWIKESIVYEQPAVHYQYQTIFQLSGSSENSPISLFYSTSPVINNLNAHSMRTALVQSAELDDNRDGKTDRIELSVQMPLASDEQVTGFSALVFCDVKLSSKARYMFDSAVLVQHNSGVGMGALNVDGDMMLRQTWPLVSKGGYRVPYDQDPLLSLDSSGPGGGAGGGLSADSVSIARIMHRSNARNLTMRFLPTSALATQGPATAAHASTAPRYFNASVVLRVPSQAVRYTPEVSVQVKQAWIQYVAFFAVVAFLLFRLNSFVLGHQLLSSRAVADIVYEKMD